MANLRLDQLHQDLMVVVPSVPDATHATDNTLRYYNFILNAILAEHINENRLTIIGAATEQTTYYDLLIMTGQLKAVLAEIAPPA